MTHEPYAAAIRIDSTTGSLLLRGPAGNVETLLTWPDNTTVATNAAPGIVMLLGAADEAGLCQAARSGAGSAGMVVVTIPDSAHSPATVHDIAGWLADHAIDLGADPGPLVMVGVGTACIAAFTAAVHLEIAGWPPLTHLVLVLPTAAFEERRGGSSTNAEHLRSVTIMLPADEPHTVDLQPLFAYGDEHVRRLPRHSVAHPTAAPQEVAALIRADLSDLAARLPVQPRRPRPIRSGGPLSHAFPTPPSRRGTTDPTTRPGSAFRATPSRPGPASL